MSRSRPQSAPQTKTPRQKTPSKYCVKQNAELGKMRARRYWTQVAATVTKAKALPRKYPRIRSWIFAFEANGSIANAKALAQRLADFSASPDLNPQPMIHGLFVADCGYFRTVPIESLPEGATRREQYDIEYTTAHTLSAFKWDVLHGLARFPRFTQNQTPAIYLYNLPADYSQVSSQTEE